MSKLRVEDTAAIREGYLKGQTTDYIAQQFGVSGQYIRRLAQENGWKDLRDSSILAQGSTNTDLVLLEAKNPENFRKDTPVTRRVILEELAKGVTPTAAARRVGIDHKTLSYWRQKDSDFDIHCHEAQGDFVENGGSRLWR